jgi:hypothetical protein
MYTNLVDSRQLVESKQIDYRREADEFRLEKQLNGGQTSFATSIEWGMALIGIVTLLTAIGQFVIA